MQWICWIHAARRGCVTHLNASVEADGGRLVIGRRDRHRKQLHRQRVAVVVGNVEVDRLRHARHSNLALRTVPETIDYYAQPATVTEYSARLLLQNTAEHEIESLQFAASCADKPDIFSVDVLLRESTADAQRLAIAKNQMSKLRRRCENDLEAGLRCFNVNKRQL